MGSGGSKENTEHKEDSDHDSDEEKPIRNRNGEIVGWVPLTEAEKLERQRARRSAYSRRSSGDSRRTYDRDSNGSGRSDRSGLGSAESKDDYKGRGSDGSQSRKSSAESYDDRKSYPSSLRRASMASNDDRASTGFSRSRRSSGDSERSRRSNRGRGSVFDRRRSPSIESDVSRDSRRRSNSKHRRRSSVDSNRSDRSDRSERSGVSERSRKSRRSNRAQSRNGSLRSYLSDDYRRHSNMHSRKNSDSRRRNSGDSRRKDSNYGRNTSVQNSRASVRSSSKQKKYTPVKRYPAPRPTVKSKPKFNREKEVAQLHKAVKGLGTDEDAIIECLSSMTSEQRQRVVQAYKTRYRKDLAAVFDDELSGDLKFLCVALITDDLVFDVQTVDTLLEDKSRHIPLIGMMTRTSSSGLKLVKKKYKREFGKELTKKIDSSASDGYRDILLAIFSDKRESGRDIDYDEAQADAEDLIEALDTRDREMFQSLLLDLAAKHNANQVREVCEAFRQVYGKELTSVTETSLGAKNAVPFNAFLEACDDSASFFAGCLRKCLKGSGTDDICLVRVIIARSEIDLQDIVDAYKELYSRSLIDDIKDDTSGDYRKLLLKLINRKH